MKFPKADHNGTGGPQKRGNANEGLTKNPIGIDHISMSCDDVDKIYEEGKAKGLEFHGEPVDFDWGARLIGLTDPFGNMLYFLKYK